MRKARLESGATFQTSGSKMAFEDVRDEETGVLLLRYDREADVVEVVRHVYDPQRRRREQIKRRVPMTPLREPELKSVR